MFNNWFSKLFCYYILFVGMALLTGSSVEKKQPTDSLSKEEVLTLLPQGLDIDDEADVARYNALLTQGEIAYPALITIIKESNDPIIISRALAILRESIGGKNEVVRQLKQILPSRMKDEGKDDIKILMAIVDALTDIGNEEDVQAFYPLLDHSNERVRIIAIRAIARRGGNDAKQFLQITRSKITTNRERQEINDAILKIETQQNKRINGNL